MFGASIDETEARGLAEAMVEAYCRGRHKFQDGRFRPGVEYVINSVARRVMADPDNVPKTLQVGEVRQSTGYGNTQLESGFSQGELVIIQRYRKQAM